MPRCIELSCDPSGHSSNGSLQSSVAAGGRFLARILFIADIVGKPGRAITRRFLAKRLETDSCDFVIANGENLAGGKGLTPATAREMFEAGVDVLTGGNHTWRNREVLGIIDDERLVRPANYPAAAQTPGRGATVLTSRAGFPVAVINLLGRTFLDHHEDPFAWAEDLAESLRRQSAIVIVDFHAEATSEKRAMFHLLDGRVTAVIGTHTHVQTADEQISPQGTAYITDAGMTGPHDSVLGVKTEIALRQLRSEMPVRHEIASDDVHLSGVIIEADADTGRAISIERVFDPPRVGPSRREGH